MFKLTQSPTVTLPVQITIMSESGAWQNCSVKAVYKRATTEQLEDEYQKLKPRDLLQLVLVRVDDLTDDMGAPVSWTDETKEALLSIPAAVVALKDKFWESQHKAPVKP